MNDASFYLALILLIGVANGSPILAKTLLKDRFATPLDFGLKLPDGQPLFGSSKTLRGLVVAVAATAITAELVGLRWRTGAAIAALAMLGDLASSSLKRRLRLAPHAQASGLDQIPEALLPLYVLRAHLNLGGWEIAVMTGAFVVLEIWLSRLLFRLRIRDRPY